MGTLEKDGSKPLSFDGKAASWPPFKNVLHHLLDKEGCGWVVEGGNAFCAMLQAAAGTWVYFDDSQSQTILHGFTLEEG